MITIGNYRILKNSGSLKAFYDDVVYWEIAKNTNKFYVTFMEGLYSIQNNRQESIATMEISYPHTASGSASTSSFITGGTRNIGQFDAFMLDDEGHAGPQAHAYNGFIPVTELRGTGQWKSLITSSEFVERTYHYELCSEEIGAYAGASGLKTQQTQQIFSASYFYPFSNHQLSVLREESTLILNLDKESELYDGIGEKGFVVIPEQSDVRVRENLDFYLKKAGLINVSITQKAPDRGR